LGKVGVGRAGVKPEGLIGAFMGFSCASVGNKGLVQQRQGLA
jgi:hypothetical protein